MADSYLIKPEKRTAPSPSRRKVAVTGAAGRIGSYFASHAPDRYELTLIDHPDVDMSELEKLGTTHQTRLGDLDRLKELFADQDTIVHLAAEPSPSAVWSDLLRDNVQGTYNAFVAAAHAGCRRVVYASSIHAVSGYPADRQVHADEPVSPGDLYGVTKCFGEAMGRYMATQHALEAIAIRIGSFQPRTKAEREENAGMINTWVSQRDLHQLIVRCVDDENLLFAIFHGLSDNRFVRMDISEARELVGYEPEDDLSRDNPALARLELEERTAPHNESHGPPSGIREDVK
jgi:UDP-glucose 4-epimerase